MDRLPLKRWAAATAVLGLGVALAVSIVLQVTRTGLQTGRFLPATATAPPLHFIDGDGRAMALSDFAGRVVLLNLWATWCLPCVRELPSLDRLQAALGGPDFQVVALAEDHGGAATVLPFLRQRQIRALSAYLDQPGAAAMAFETQGLPTTLLIDRDGREVGWMLGGTDWDAGPARQTLEALIAAGRPGPNAKTP
jgi:thiol-disulfide isomerase/thioredoxin